MALKLLIHQVSPELYTEKDLLSQLAKGNEHAFRQLFDLYKVKLYSFVWQLTHSKADAEEIVQEVFLKLWEMRGRLTEVQEPGKYIYTIARNKTFNHLTKIARDQQLEHQLWLNISMSATSTEEILDAEESQQLIRQALELLPEQKRTIFRLSREEGLTHEEIAVRIGLSKSRVNNLLVEILRHIRDFLRTHSVLLSTAFWISYSAALLQDLNLF